MIIILLLLLSHVFSCINAMSSQPFYSTPARTPYWYRSQERSREQAQMKKYWKKRSEQEQAMPEDMPMQPEYKPSSSVMNEYPD